MIGLIRSKSAGMLKIFDLVVRLLICDKRLERVGYNAYTVGVTVQLCTENDSAYHERSCSVN